LKISKNLLILELIMDKGLKVGRYLKENWGLIKLACVKEV